MSTPQHIMVHGTALSLQVPGMTSAAVLLRGASGTGKSDLALRLIGMGGTLIGDDQVRLSRHQDKIIAEAADTIHGLIEVRGVGLVQSPVASPARLRLVVDLVPRADVPRLPEWEKVDILGIAIAALKLHAFDASTPCKIIKAIELVYNPGLLVR